MPPEVHATLSASASHRWLNCPASIEMAKLFPSRRSPYAAEGTIAHAMAEAEITSDALAAPAAKLAEAQLFYADNPAMEGSAAEMARYVRDYVDFVKETYATAKASDSSAILLTEQHVDYGEYAPGGFGTADAVIVANGELTIIDLKFGRGVVVDAPNNPQLRLYALGVLDGYRQVYDIDKVTMTIVQPRLTHISTETLTADELRAWGETVVKPAAERVASHPMEGHSGDWCRFCPGAGACKTRATECMDFVDLADSRELLTLSSDEIAEIFGGLDRIETWTKAVRNFALSEAICGKTITGYKVVEGKSNRKYIDETKVAAAATEAGWNEAMIYERKLLGVSAMERLMGRKEFAEVCGALVEKPQGKPTLVPESDKRPPFSTADFDDVDSGSLSL